MASARGRDLFQEPPADIKELKIFKQANRERLAKLAKLAIAAREAGHEDHMVLEEMSVIKLMQATTESVTRQLNDLRQAKDRVLDRIKGIKDR
eukprot:4573304-Pyramimonas_sp.AAC.1